MKSFIVHEVKILVFLLGEHRPGGVLSAVAAVEAPGVGEAD